MINYLIYVFLELDEFLQDLDEDVEGMQSTIYFLQQELKKARESVTLLQQENTSLKSASTDNNLINLTNGLSPHTPPIKKEEPEENPPTEEKQIIIKFEENDRYKGARTPPLPSESTTSSDNMSVDKPERTENKIQTEPNDESSSDSAALIIKVENELLSEREDEEESRTSKRTLRTKSNSKSSGKTNGEEVLRTTRGRDKAKREKSVPSSDDERIIKKKRKGSLLESNDGEEESLVLTNGEILQSDPE